MPAFIELFAVELAVAVSAGAVLAFVSGLASAPTGREPGHRRLRCRDCGSAMSAGAGPDQYREAERHQQ
jgi:hypothetical protein